MFWLGRNQVHHTRKLIRSQDLKRSKTMIIQGDFFQLTPSHEHSTQFDLKLLYQIKGKNPREEYKDAGYGLSLEAAIKKCIQYAINQKHEVLTLKEYLDEYKKMQTELGLQLQGSPIHISFSTEPSV